MSKIAVIYWSGTGNTEAMADLVANAAAGAGASVDKFTASEFNISSAGDYTGFALGCPAMGAEQLEESEFEPMYQNLRGSLSGKPVGLFGSYGWGDGEWIRTWAEDAEAAVPVWSLSLSWPTAPPTATPRLPAQPLAPLWPMPDFLHIHPYREGQRCPSFFVCAARSLPVIARFRTVPERSRPLPTKHPCSNVRREGS